MGYNSYYIRQSPLNSDTFLINDITEAIIAEAQDYYFYERLAELATNE